MADIRVENHGSVALLRPLTKAGEGWLTTRVQAEGWQWFGGALAAEPRYAAPIIEGAVNDGLEVEA